MAVRVPQFILALAASLLLWAPLAHAQSCGANAYEIGRSETGTKVTLTCRCDGGFWRRNDACVEADLAAKQSEQEFEIIVSGTRGEALPQRDQLIKYALGQSWSFTAKTVFLSSILSAATARFGRARVYLKLMEWDDQIGKSYSALVDRRQQELQSSNYVLTGLERQLFSNLRKANNEDYALVQWYTSRAKYFAGHGHYVAAESDYRAARLKTDDRMMQQELNNAILITQYITQYQRKLRGPEAEPSIRDSVNLLAREGASAQHAWHMAFALNEAGQNGKSTDLYREAIKGFQVTKPELVPLLTQQLDVVMHGDSLRWNPPALPLGETKPPPTPPVRDIYRASTYTRADAILDAVEYGRGDWKRSIRFLEAATLMDPTNQKFTDALAQVKELREKAEELSTVPK